MCIQAKVQHSTISQLVTNLADQANSYKIAGTYVAGSEKLPLLFPFDFPSPKLEALSFIDNNV